MTDILGYDVNGRPLRAGDWVMVVGAKAQPESNGCVYRLTGIWNGSMDAGYYARYGQQTPIELDDGDFAAPSILRRLDDRTGHQPSEYTFDELLDTLKTGAPDNANA